MVRRSERDKRDKKLRQCCSYAFLRERERRREERIDERVRMRKRTGRNTNKNTHDTDKTERTETERRKRPIGQALQLLSPEEGL